MASTLIAMVVLLVLLGTLDPAPWRPAGLGLAAGYLAGAMDSASTRIRRSRLAGGAWLAVAVVPLVVVLARLRNEGALPLLAAVAAFETVRGAVRWAVMRRGDRVPPHR